MAYSGKKKRQMTQDIKLGLTKYFFADIDNYEDLTFVAHLSVD